MNAADRVLEIVQANNMRIVDDRIVTELGDQSCLLADAVAAEAGNHPTDVEHQTGWLFGEGVDWQ